MSSPPGCRTELGAATMQTSGASTLGSGKLADEQMANKCTHAINVVKRALDLYGSEGLAFSFNGGKDSTALLHIMLDAVRQWMDEQGLPRTAGSGLLDMHCFFFHGADEFQEVVDFAMACSEAEGLAMQVYTCGFKEGLQTIVSERPVKAIFLGSRRGDPNCHDQDFYCPSSAGWPCFMRINPILDWSYHDVWTYLRAIDAKYCPLYDLGYTSLGSKATTEPNSALVKPDGSFAPAHMLADGRLERSGRQDSRTLQKTQSTAAHAYIASLLIVGDEILQGKVADVNTAFLGQALHKLGWRVGKVTILPDDADAIGRELRVMRAASDVVITAGGIGPTVDDVTIAGVAQAHDCRVIRHPDLEAGLRDYFGDQITEAHLKMAEVPDCEVQLLPVKRSDSRQSPFPVVRAGNTFILPGVPHLLRQKWGAVARAVLEFSSSDPFHNRVMRLKITDETVLASPVAALSAQFPSISVGSYPVVDQADDAGVLISIEGKGDEHVQQAMDKFQELVDAEAVPRSCIIGVTSNKHGLDAS